MLLDKIKDRIILFLIAAWIVFAANFIVEEIRNAAAVGRENLDLSLEEKLTRLDRDFFRFMQFCSQNIPPGSFAVFFAEVGEYNKIHKDKAGLFLLQHAEKSAYYLYPTLVYPKIEMLNEKTGYIIVYNGNISPAGFRQIAVYGKNKYILRRE